MMQIEKSKESVKVTENVSSAAAVDMLVGKFHQIQREERRMSIERAIIVSSMVDEIIAGYPKKVSRNVCYKAVGTILGMTPDNIYRYDKVVNKLKLKSNDGADTFSMFSMEVLFELTMYSYEDAVTLVDKGYVEPWMSGYYVMKNITRPHGLTLPVAEIELRYRNEV